MLQELTRRLISGIDLTPEEAEGALELILSEDASDVAIASFLTAMSIKGESPSELAAFARVMRRHAVPVRRTPERLVDTAGTGGGAETFNISTAAAFVIAGSGLAVAKHGNRAVTSRSGSADVLAALGVRIDGPTELAEVALNECGIGFFFAPLFHPSMKRVAAIRKELGHRTIFNLLGPLANPAAASFQIIGVFAPELTEKLAAALSRLDNVRAWVVHSRDGMDELSARTRSVVSEVTGSQLRSFEFDPEELEIRFELQDEAGLEGGTPEENARKIRGILEGRVRGVARQTVLINAAAAIHLVEQGGFASALRRAGEALDSGAAQASLERLVEVSNR